LVKPGDILIAKPFFLDGYFKRSVIYLSEHNSEGSMGFVINKPQGLLLKDIFPHLKYGNFPLFEGGPVSPNQLFYTHTLGQKLSDSLEISKGVYWGGNFFELSYFIEHGKISANQIRFYIGYSGWDKDQLSQEMKNESWLTHKGDYDALMKTHPKDMWGTELSKINPGYKAFSDFSFDPSLN
jgi:putative transcriptional regulator